jgi:hypothetical protein
MGYQVFLIDESDGRIYAELDCEDLDQSFGITYSVAQIEDISKRTDKVSKTLLFKATPRNNEALGNLYHLNRRTNLDISNNIGFNYNSLRPPKCLVYEDSVLILEGTFQVVDMKQDANGFLTYQCLISGGLSDIKQVLADKTLADLDLSDLSHTYNWTAITDSWNLRTQRGNSFQPYKDGSGYVYPFIDYGNGYLKADEPFSESNSNIKNWKPALFVREYLNRIFEQVDGFSYQIKGSEEFIESFDKLIVPCNVEVLTGSRTDLTISAGNAGSITQDKNKTFYTGSSPYKAARALSLPTQDLSQYLVPIGSVFGENNTVFLVSKTFKTSGKITCNGTFKLNAGTQNKVSVELCEREFIATGSTNEFRDVVSFSKISGQTFSIQGGQTIIQNIAFGVPDREFKKGTQLCLRVIFESNYPLFFEQGGGIGHPVVVFYTVSNINMILPGVTGGLVTYEAELGDLIIPQPPANIKQIDFIKSLMAMFNLYLYTDPENSRRYIFERYDDYYALQSNLPANALDWSQKVNQSNITQTPNISIPKKYLFTYKEDADYWNALYKSEFNDVYGSMRFSDRLGIGEEKKVELIFSATPIIQPVGAGGRTYPGLHNIADGKKEPTKTNIRILYYNGVRQCEAWKVGNDVVTGEGVDIAFIQEGLTQYPNCSTYLLDSDNKPVSDLSFFIPKRMYHDVTTEHQTCPRLYQSHYINQVTQLTNPDMKVINCEVNLNSIDISNLDLSVPVFITIPHYGYAYAKVLSVEYDGKGVTSTVKLQTIP